MADHHANRGSCKEGSKGLPSMLRNLFCDLQKIRCRGQKQAQDFFLGLHLPEVLMRTGGNIAKKIRGGVNTNEKRSDEKRSSKKNFSK